MHTDFPVGTMKCEVVDCEEWCDDVFEVTTALKSILVEVVCSVDEEGEVFDKTDELEVDPSS